jgi:hypothetical protein
MRNVMAPLGHSSAGCPPAALSPPDAVPVPPVAGTPPVGLPPAAPPVLPVAPPLADLPAVEIGDEPAALLPEPAPLPPEAPFAWSSAVVPLAALSLAVNWSPLHAATVQQVTKSQAQT